MKKLFILFLFFSFTFKAQDKLFFRNGTSRKGIIVTNAKDYVYFRASDTSGVEKIKKSKLVLMEDYKGTRYLFAEEDIRKDSVGVFEKEKPFQRNVLSIQPLALLFGRANVSYERLSKDGKIGFVIPFILTYDPKFGNIFTADSTFHSVHVKGISFITGLDINCYFGKRDGVKLFLGPRFRYGTDIAFYNTEAYSLQTQIGLRVGKDAGRVIQHLSLGFGFVKLISSATLRVNAKQAYPWYSINYRLGVKW